MAVSDLTEPVLPPERTGFPAPTDLAERRSGLAAAIAAGLYASDPPPLETTIGGVRVLRFEPPGPSLGTLIHIHGGAFRIGSPETVARFATALAERCRISIFCPAYRLAPEHPFPAGLRDAWNLVCEIAKSETRPLLISGDSAGGAIAAGLVRLSVDANLPVAGLALLSPWLDLTVRNASFARNATCDPLFSKAAAAEAARLYLQGVAPTHPLASPSFGPVERFPPTFINVGSGEVLLDDANRFADRLGDAGTHVSLEIVEAMEHVAVTRDVALPGALQTFDCLARFVEARL